jgi:inner membrane protein
MDPLTHFLTGACLGRAGFNRKTAYATLAMTLAAEAPDLDVLWGLRGPVAAFEHHRGITHTFIGAPFVALLVTGAVWLMDRSGVLSKKRPEMPFQTPNWILLWMFSLVAVLSHLLLDYTNNYGLRPFFPFNPRWYSADLVFIFEPLLWLVLIVALVMPAVLGLADREIGVRQARFRGSGWAVFALCSMVLLWTVRYGEHQHALHLVEGGALTDAHLLHVGVEPYPVNPFHWSVVAETPDYFQSGQVDTWTNIVDPGIGSGRLYKPPVTMAMLVAKRSWLGHVYLDWSQFPYVEDRGDVQAPGIPYPGPGGTSVEFRDLRYGFSGASAKDPPLSGWVYVGPGQAVDGMSMGGRFQK